MNLKQYLNGVEAEYLEWMKKQLEQNPDNLLRHYVPATSEFITYRLTQLALHLAERAEKEARKEAKKWWWDEGRWHLAGCYFLRSDEGVCNCKGKPDFAQSIRSEVKEV